MIESTIGQKADVTLRREGILDTGQESNITEAGKPIETHLTDVEAMMEARQRSESHVKENDGKRGDRTQYPQIPHWGNKQNLVQLPKGGQARAPLPLVAKSTPV